MKTTTSLHAALGLALALVAATLAPTNARAQQTAKVVATCGAAGYTAGFTNYQTMDTGGGACPGAGGTGTGAQQVQGATASGVSTTGTNPVRIGANDDTGLAINLTAGLSNNDALSAGGTVSLRVLSLTMIDNGASYARWRSPANISTNGNDLGAVGLASVYNTTLPTYTNGQYGTLQMTPSGALTVAIAPTSVATSAIIPSISASSGATSLVAKASAGNYYDAYCQSTAAGRCIVYNATSVPGGGALTANLVLECAVVPAGGTGSIQYNGMPRNASVGIVVLMSSSADCNTYTASSTAYIHASVQ